MKNYLFILIFMGSINALATESPTARGADLFQHGVAVDSDGNYSRMNQRDAIAYCARLGMSLPDDRDFAEFSVLHGAKIRETKFALRSAGDAIVIAEINEMKDEGFRALYVYYEDRGLSVAFYHNPTGFKKPDIMPDIDRFISATKNAQWESTRNPLELLDPVPDNFNTLGHLDPSIYRERHVTCTAIFPI